MFKDGMPCNFAAHDLNIPGRMFNGDADNAGVENAGGDCSEYGKIGK